ncbi:MAG: TolC family protein [Planctomycetota bacterium]|nr:TolC family protein [Planctomycetota bacterium]
MSIHISPSQKSNVLRTSAALGLVLLAGCRAGPMSVDDQIARLTQRTSDAVRTIPENPRPISTRLDNLRQPNPKNPPTSNPAASELSFVPADEARDVGARLDAYSRLEHDDAQVLTLSEALRTAQRSGPQFLGEQERYILAAIALLVERHLWGPRFFNDTTLGLDGSGDDGRFDHALSVVNSLRATQRLPSGGSVEAAWVWDATEQLRETVGGRYTQSSAIVLSGQIPLLRGAGEVARESLIQRERDLVYAAREFERFRRAHLLDIASDYFELQNIRATIVNQERQLESLRANARRVAARVEAGRVEAFEKGIADNEVLSAEASLASLRENFVLALERYKIRLGLPPDQRIALSDETLNLPEPEIGLDEASRLALEFRLDLQNARDRLDDQRRAVANARNDLLPDLNLRGTVTLPTDDEANVGSLAFSPDDVRYDVSATLGLPLDREQERLRVRAEIIQLEQAIRDYQQFRDTVVVGVRSSLRNVELARFQLTLAEQQVEINRKRKRGQELRADLVGAQAVIDSENALLAAENQRDRARTNLRIAVLNYLLETDQLRVTRDGLLDPLPGLVPPSASETP